VSFISFGDSGTTGETGERWTAILENDGSRNGSIVSCPRNVKYLGRQHRMWDVLFQNWSTVVRTVVVGVLAYVTLIMVLRFSGKRTLSKMNAFDLVVTVALGSTLATILLSKDVALAEGVTALLVLIGMQYIVAWLSVRSKRVRQLVRSEPRLLARNGELLNGALKDERVSRDEALAAIRSGGSGDLSQIDALILETDGSFSVIATAQQPATAVRVVKGWETQT
jgi:uncharacterized membrane protein YcaP (DUF421 family)